MLDYIGYSTTVAGYTFPPWAEGIGWLMSVSSILCIPIFAVYQFIKYSLKKEVCSNDVVS